MDAPQAGSTSEAPAMVPESGEKCQKQNVEKALKTSDLTKLAEEAWNPRLYTRGTAPSYQSDNLHC